MGLPHPNLGSSQIPPGGSRLAFPPETRSLVVGGPVALGLASTLAWGHTLVTLWGVYELQLRHGNTCLSVKS